MMTSHRTSTAEAPQGEVFARAGASRQRGVLRDMPVDVKVVLSGLWVATLFVFAYVDIFTFWRADAINGALSGEVPDTGFAITGTFLALTTLYVLVPSVMVVVSLIAPARVNRPANLVAGLLYAVSVVVSAVGESWGYYLIGSAVEMVLLLTIVATAWRWPRRVEPRPIDVGR